MEQDGLDELKESIDSLSEEERSALGQSYVYCFLDAYQYDRADFTKEEFIAEMEQLRNADADDEELDVNDLKAIAGGSAADIGWSAAAAAAAV